MSKSLSEQLREVAEQLEAIGRERKGPAFDAVAWNKIDEQRKELQAMRCKRLADAQEIEKLRKELAERDRKDGWVEWSGGKCPVDPSIEVEYKMRGWPGTHRRDAGNLDWEDNGRLGDIVAYRVVQNGDQAQEIAKLKEQLNTVNKLAVGRGIELERQRALNALLSAELDAKGAAVERIGKRIAKMEGAPSWITWDGGDCPVKPEQIVQVRLRCGAEREGLAGLYAWGHDGRAFDIISYRVVDREPVKPKFYSMDVPTRTLEEAIKTLIKKQAERIEQAAKEGDYSATVAKQRGIG